MGTVERVDFSLPQAQRLAELLSIQIDLFDVQQYCFMLRDSTDPALTEPYARAALTKAAAISYGRIGGPSARSVRISDLVAQLPDELKHWNSFFKDFRDKFIAHSVNAFEELRVDAWVEVGDNGRCFVQNVAPSNGRHTYLAPDEVQAFLDLAQAMLSLVIGEIGRETQLVLAAARSMPDKFFLDRIGHPIVPYGLPAKVGKRRAAFGEKKSEKPNKSIENESQDRQPRER